MTKQYTDWIKSLNITIKHVRDPIEQSRHNDWHKTADKWLVIVDGEEFDYYICRGVRI